MTNSPRRLPRSEGLDLAFALVVVGLSGFTAARVVLGSGAVNAPGLDLALDTITVVVAVAVATLSYSRFRVHRDAMALSECGAFVVFSIADVVALLPRLTSLEPTSATTGLEEWIVTFGPLVGAAILFWGALRSSRRDRTAFPLGAVLALFLGVVGLALATQVHPTGPPLLARGSVFGPWIQGSAAALFAAASYLLRRVYLRDRFIGDAYLVVALAIAAFSQLNGTLDLGRLALLVTATDVLRLLFNGILLFGLVAAFQASLTALDDANLRLKVLRDHELDLAALKERANLARELHDGLAQNLWVAKLKAARLISIHGQGQEAGLLSQELMAAIDAGLAEAKQAVMTWRHRAPGSFAELMSEYVDDFSDAFSLRAEFTCDQDLPRLAPRAEAELLRIAQEALSNARRHADATLVSVQASVVDENLRLVVADNGRGFETKTRKSGAFGLTSMQERAALIGGTLTVASELHDGTRVSVDVPLAAATSHTFASTEFPR